MAIYFDDDQLRKKPPPTKRAAYSDRTAWLMAEMSAMAYEKFEGDKSRWHDLTKKLAKEMNLRYDGDPASNIEPGFWSKIKGRLLHYVRPRFKEMETKGFLDTEKIVTLLETEVSATQNMADGKQMLDGHLLNVQYEIRQLFNKKGTQAFLAINKDTKIAILSFRGTETKSLTDIKSDLKAVVAREGKIKTHSGFLEAYGWVQSDLISALRPIDQEDYALYITGHSLGGALAVVATRDLEKQFGNIASCYTFGSPRVGNIFFYDNIKTPIYRVVNRADIVSNVPPGSGLDWIIWLLQLIAKSNIWGPFCDAIKIVANFLDDKFGGYRHGGDQRYLTNSSETKNHSDVRLIRNITLFDYFKGFITSKLNFKATVGDHDIKLYCRKLAAFAKKRNQK